MWCEECYWVIAPIVFEVALVSCKRFSRKFVDRHEFNSSDAQTLQVRNFFDYSKVCSRMVHTARRARSESSNMKFIDDGVGQPMAKMPITLPIKVIIYHDAFRWTDDAIFMVKKMTGQSFRVGVNEPGRWVESMSCRCIEWTIRLEMIKLSML